MDCTETPADLTKHNLLLTARVTSWMFAPVILATAATITPSQGTPATQRALDDAPRSETNTRIIS